MFAILLFLFAFFSVSQGVILSLEESETGAVDYRYLYLTVNDISNGVYDLPFFTLVNNQTSRPYGALGSLVCGSSTDGIAVYMDVNNDGFNEWTCQSINLLPFAHQGTGAPNPPLCGVLTPDETPALWNTSTGAYECGPYNQHLTLATRVDIGTPCQTADFLQMYSSVDEIRCVSPSNITVPNGRRDIFAERVDTAHDMKWFVVMSDMDMNGFTSRTWNYWKWTSSMNYDSTASSSTTPAPPVSLPFSSNLVAVTFASFLVQSYTYQIYPPSQTDSFNGYVSKLSTTLAETGITNTILFNSVSATSGQLTVPTTGYPTAACVPGETFVGGVLNRAWSTLPSSSDQHLVAITLWIQTNQSFTEFFWY